ncbi:hypothetical protein HAX54_016034 [Datura stramonium]|uniref:Uncharacterized protein n=1 Tax=Datura stramonium TaxID=4076 RepID=A0ABS8Y7X9_DATST|nr:hypothetical protein [Datura stramonium]
MVAATGRHPINDPSGGYEHQWAEPLVETLTIMKLAGKEVGSDTLPVNGIGITADSKLSNLGFVKGPEQPL